MARRYGGSCHGYMCLAILATIGRRAKPEVASIDEPGVKDYCLSDVFEAECPENEVILIQIARYGRMRMGSCVRTSYGSIGCYTDVVPIMDMHCSGRRKCSFRVPDPLFEKFLGTNCQEFKTYLSASFVCVPVVSIKDFPCSSAQQLRLTSPTGYIPSLLQSPSDGTGTCRSDSLPWLIEVETGKKVLFTLYDFGLVEFHDLTRNGAFVPSSGCNQYAEIVDVGSSQMHRVCGGRARIAEVYTSVTNAVQVRIARKEKMDEKQTTNDDITGVHFLIHYRAIGCSDPELPANVWFRRSGDQATVGCAFGDRQWQIKCTKNDWIGIAGNCSQEALSYGSDQSMTSGGLLSLPYEVSLAIIVGLAFVVGVTVFTLGVIMLKRNNFHGDRLAETQRVALADRTRTGVIDAFGVRLDRGGTLSSPSKYGGHSLFEDCRHQGQGSCPGGESDYAYVWDNPTEPGGDTGQVHLEPPMHYLHPVCQIVARMPPGGVYETTVNHPDNNAHSKMDLFDDGRVVMMNRVEHLA